MKDAGQKEVVFKHYCAQGCFTVPEVPVYFSGGEHTNAKLITDIDVFALRPGNNLRWDVLIADCKTLKGQSPANRAIWLSGLMRGFGSTEAIIVLQRRKNQRIESDHKLFASSLGISLLDEDEFKTFDRALVYPDGTERFNYHAADVNDLWKVKETHIGLKRFADFLSCDAWQNTDFVSLLRSTLGEGISVSKELDPAKSEHIALVCQAIAVFSVGLASVTGIVFQRYLQPESEVELADALKVIIWGGKERYDFIAKLRGQLLEAKGIEVKADAALALPDWPTFVQLVRKQLDNPNVGFRVPHMLQIAALDIRLGQPFLSSFNTSNLEAAHFAMRTAKYFVNACRFSQELSIKIVDLFAQRLSKLAHEKA